LKPGGSNFTVVTFVADPGISPATIHYLVRGYAALVLGTETTIDVLVT
jgi:hypothetical protein